MIRKDEKDARNLIKKAEFAKKKERNIFNKVAKLPRL